MAWAILILTLQSPGPDWNVVPVDEFLREYEPAAERLKDFYGNCTVEMFHPGSSITWYVKTLDNQWFSNYTLSDGIEQISVVRSDGRFELRFDTEQDAWVPRHVSSSRTPHDTLPGDYCFSAFYSGVRRLTYYDFVQSDPDAVQIFRKGSRYRIHSVRKQMWEGTLLTGQLYSELDAAMFWVCVEGGATWDDTGIPEPCYYRYRQAGPDDIPILESYELPSDPTQNLVFKNFKATPADPAVFKLTTYGLPESLIKPKVAAGPPKWGWLQSPVSLLIVGCLLLLIAQRLRDA